MLHPPGPANRRARHPLAFLLATLVTIGCVGGTIGPIPDNGEPPPGGTGSGGISGMNGTLSGLPCAVQTLLQNRCQSCHATSPVAGAPMSLMTASDLRAPARSNTALSVAQMALMRMQDNLRPMPPAPGLRASAAEIQAMSDWVSAGYPAGASCGGTSTTGSGGNGGGSTTGGGGATGSGGTGSGGGGTGSGSGGSGGGVQSPNNGVPCDVLSVFQRNCHACHGTVPANGAPMSLVTYANLTSASTTSASMTWAQRALARMQDNARPMPPAPNARALTADIQTVSAWVAAGYPRASTTTCGGPTTGTGGAGGGTGGGGRGGSGGGTGTGGMAGSGGATGSGGTSGGTGVLPCDVETLLRNRCQTCHGSAPASGAPMSLVTYANLTTRSFANSAQTFAQRTIVRMQDNGAPMPPAPGTRATSAEIQAMSNWVAAGYPSGPACGGTGSGGTGGGGTGGTGGGNDPLSQPPVCTSNTYWTGGNNGNQLMNPGRACITCHRNEGEEEAPLFALAGTVFPTGHEPDRCNGVNGSATGARVVIVDASNRTITLTPNAAGNFFYTGAITFPFRAKVTYQGRERIMSAAQTNGDCNSCHTQNGANGAPGRITLP